MTNQVETLAKQYLDGASANNIQWYERLRHHSLYWFCRHCWSNIPAALNQSSDTQLSLSSLDGLKRLAS